MRIVSRIRAFLSSGFAAATILAIAVVVPSHADAGTMTTVYSFCAETNCTDGARPNEAGLVLDQDGNLYGTAVSGGSHNGGVIFKLRLQPNGRYSYHVLYNFCSQTNCSDGEGPYGSLVIDRRRNLYGLLYGVNGSSDGAVFKLVSGATPAVQILYSFCAQTKCADGTEPRGGLTYAGAAAGKPYDGTSPLFGTTVGGGITYVGTAFELDPGTNGWTEQVIYSFCTVQFVCGDGASPEAALYEDSSGNLYGTTMNGGAYRRGTIFELQNVQNAWKETVIDSFCSERHRCPDGIWPKTPLTMDSAGNLIGFDYRYWINRVYKCEATRAIPCGIIYSLAPGLQHHTVLYNFCNPNGYCPGGVIPDGRPVIDSSGNIFGVNQYGPYRSGTLFELSGSTLQVLYTFCKRRSCAGSEPTGGIIRDAAGNIYGETRRAGRHGFGTVYKYTP